MLASAIGDTCCVHATKCAGKRNIFNKPISSAPVVQPTAASTLLKPAKAQMMTSKSVIQEKTSKVVSSTPKPAKAARMMTSKSAIQAMISKAVSPRGKPAKAAQVMTSTVATPKPAPMAAASKALKLRASVRQRVEAARAVKKVARREANQSRWNAEDLVLSHRSLFYLLSPSDLEQIGDGDLGLHPLGG